jgi:hypothetical protein
MNVSGSQKKGAWRVYFPAISEVQCGQRTAARGMFSLQYDVHSAGVEASKADPRAVKGSEIGIDISVKRSKRMDEYRGTLFDLAVTVCDKAKEMCPICSVSLISPRPSSRCIMTNIISPT